MAEPPEGRRNYMAVGGVKDRNRVSLTRWCPNSRRVSSHRCVTTPYLAARWQYGSLFGDDTNRADRAADTSSGVRRGDDAGVHTWLRAVAARLLQVEHRPRARHGHRARS